MIFRRQLMIAPPKRQAVTMAIAVSLLRGDARGHRQNAASDASDHGSEKGRPSAGRRLRHKAREIRGTPAGGSTSMVPCETTEQCWMRYEDMQCRGWIGIDGRFHAGKDRAVGGCFVQGGDVYFGDGRRGQRDGGTVKRGGRVHRVVPRRNGGAIVVARPCCPANVGAQQFGGILDLFE
jgi:hypothetical protein